jgi:mRNA interferase MazF
LKRGDIITVAPPDEFGKPRPALVIQSDLALPAPTITFLPITSDLRRVPLIRVPVSPSGQNGLLKPSEVMVDMIQTSSSNRIGKVVGHLDRHTMQEVEQALMIHLGLA